MNFQSAMRAGLSQRPMIADTTVVLHIAEHLDEIEQLVVALVDGDLTVCGRLIEIHMSTAIYYSRCIAGRYSSDVDVVVSNYIMGMFDACLRLSDGRAVPDKSTGYILSRGRSFAVNGVENPSTGWNRESYRTAKRAGLVLPLVSSMVVTEQEGFDPSYLDDGIDIIDAANAYMLQLDENQQKLVLLLAKGYTDREAAIELHWCATKVREIKAQAILILEAKVFHHRSGQ